MGQRPAAQDQQLQRVVEHRRVAALGVDDGEQLGQVVAEELRDEHLLARVHPVEVAADRVDLAVVEHVAERLRPRPAWKGVGAEAGMDHGERGVHRGVGQIGVELLQLLRGQHPLVNDRLVGKTGDVEVLTPRQLRPENRVLGKLADHVQLPLERQIIRDPFAAADEDLPHDGFRRLSGGAERSIVGRHGAPAQHRLPGLANRLLQLGLTGRALPRIGRQINHADPVRARGGEIDAGFGADGPEEGVGHLKQDARAVAGVGLAAARPAVAQVHQHSQRVAQNLVRAPSVNIGDKPDAARSAFSARVVEGIVEQTRVRHIHKGSPLISGSSAPGGLKLKGHPERIDAWVASSLSKNQRKIRVAASQPHRAGVTQPQC